MATKTISTHTLTWSVTLHSMYLLQHTLISTHTLTWSVTCTGANAQYLIDISTHTLTWSVTPKNVVNSNIM